MRKIKLCTLLLLVTLIFTPVASFAIPNFTITAEAHSGRTDASGGHRDNKNKSGLGSYHYHCGGNPAHLHNDGVCPYGGNSAGSSSGSSTESSSSVAPVTAPAAPTASSSEPATVSTYDSVIFNTSYYLQNNADVASVIGTNASDLYNHFITSGMKEGRQGSTTFNVAAYMNNNPDLLQIFGEDLPSYYNHFLTNGQFEGRVAY